MLAQVFSKNLLSLAMILRYHSLFRSVPSLPPRTLGEAVESCYLRSRDSYNSLIYFLENHDIFAWQQFTVTPKRTGSLFLRISSLGHPSITPLNPSSETCGHPKRTDRNSLNTHRIFLAIQAKAPSHISPTQTLIRKCKALSPTLSNYPVQGILTVLKRPRIITRYTKISI